MTNVTAEDFFGVSPPANNVSADAFFAGSEPRVAQGETEKEKLGFLERLSVDMQRRREMMDTVLEATLPGEDNKRDQSYAEGILQAAGKVGAGGVLDFIGEVTVSAGRGLSKITPDVIEQPLKNAVTSAGHAFLNTAVGQKGLNAAKDGLESWVKFREDHPRAARNIEAVVDIALLLAPAKGKKKPSKLGTAAEAVDEKAAIRAAANRGEFVDDLVLPKQVKKVREAQVPRTTEKGILRSKQVALSKQEQEIAREVRSIAGVSKKKTLQGNYNAIQKEVSLEAKSLKSRLKRNDFDVNLGEYGAALDDVSRGLENNPLIVGDAAKVAERIIQKAKDLASNNKATGSGLLKARKELDSWAKSQKGAKIFDPNLESAMSIALREVRTETNNFLAMRAKNVAVKQSLRRQSNLIRALDNIAPKAADEANNALLRVWKKAIRILPLRGEFNQSMAILFGVGGLGAAAVFAPAFTKLAFGSFGAYASYRYLTSPPAMKLLASIMRGTDKMIRAAKGDANLLMALKADRAIIAELMKASEEEPDVDE